MRKDGGVDTTPGFTPGGTTPFGGTPGAPDDHFGGVDIPDFSMHEVYVEFRFMDILIEFG